MLLALFSLALAAAVPTAASADAPPPAPAAPVTIQLGSGESWIRRGPTEDVVLLCPPGLKTGATILEGGHDWTIKGCDLTVPKAAEKRDDMFRRAIYVKGATGTVTIDDVQVTNPEHAQFDAFFLDAPDADVRLTNVRVEGLFGWYRAWHSDTIQTSNRGVRSLSVNGMTIVGYYQGVTGFAQNGLNGSIVLERVNVRATGRAVDDPVLSNNGGTAIWLTRGLSCEPGSASVTLREFYVKQWSVRGPGHVGYPNKNVRGCPAVVAPNGYSVSWPGLPVDGSVRIGNPRGGDFVPPRGAGPTVAAK